MPATKTVPALSGTIRKIRRATWRAPVFTGATPYRHSAFSNGIHINKTAQIVKERSTRSVPAIKKPRLASKANRGSGTDSLRKAFGALLLRPPDVQKDLLRHDCKILFFMPSARANGSGFGRIAAGLP